MSTINLQIKTLSELVVNNFNRAEILLNYNLDFYHDGDMTLQKICLQKNINFNDILQDFKNQNQEEVLNFELFNANECIAYILKTYHEKLNQKMPLIYQKLQKIVETYKQDFPQFEAILDVFYSLQQELESHMYKEEKILFPYIKELENSVLNGAPVPQGCFGSVQAPINVMEEEHRMAGNKLKELEQLTRNFTAPSHTSTTIITIFADLAEFKRDLIKHIHLENCILHKKALEFEKTIKP